MKRMLCLLGMAGVMLCAPCPAATEESEIPSDYAENRRYLGELMSAAKTCSRVELYIWNCETDEERTVELTAEDIKAVRHYIFLMEPCCTNIAIDIAPCEVVELRFYSPGGGQPMTLDVSDVDAEDNADENGEYMLAHFTLKRTFYTEWCKLISELCKRR